MAETTVNSANVAQVWDSKFFAEYVRDTRFRRYMGTDENAVIQLKEQLTKRKGDTINIPLITRLQGDGVTGNTTLEGNEEALIDYNHAIEIDVLRNAVKITEWEEQKTEMDLRMAGKMMLKLWAMDKMREHIIRALESVNVDGVTEYADGTAADTWNTNNSDRVLYGTAVSNYSAGDHGASLTNVATGETMDADTVSLLKRIAKTADPHIRPIRVGEDEEWFVMFCGSLVMAKLKADTTMNQANREAWIRGKSNPLFRDGDLIYDGVIIREIPEMRTIADVGAGGTVDVGLAAFCGAQAVGVAWGQRTTSRTDVTDYGFRHGVAVQEIRGIERLTYNNKMHGMVWSATSVD